MGKKFATLARKAAAQHGRIASRQLVAEGIDHNEIRRWVESGRLFRVHHGVYAVGHHGRTTESDYMAAVLACGEGAVLSHRAAAYLLKLLRGSAPAPEVTVRTNAHRRRPGIVIHRVRTLDVRDTSELDGIPITTVPRVLLDLAPALAPELLARACHRAWIHHETAPPIVEACIARNPGKPGAAKLRRALGSDVTLSVLEDGFVKLLRAHGLPLPRTNIDRVGDKVDCHWPHTGLTVELQSFRYHATRTAFETDLARRRRSNHLAFSYGDVFEREAATIAELATQLPRAPGAPRR
jgi:hypothetical protein